MYVIHALFSIQFPIIRGCLRVCGVQGKSLVHGPRALNFVLGCVCMLDAMLFNKTNDLIDLRALHPFMPDKQLDCLERGPIKVGPQGHGLFCLCLNPPPTTTMTYIHLSDEVQETVLGNTETNKLISKIHIPEILCPPVVK